MRGSNFRSFAGLFAVAVSVVVAFGMIGSAAVVLDPSAAAGMDLTFDPLEMVAANPIGNALIVSSDVLEPEVAPVAPAAPAALEPATPVVLVAGPVVSSGTVCEGGVCRVVTAPVRVAAHVVEAVAHPFSRSASSCGGSYASAPVVRSSCGGAQVRRVGLFRWQRVR